MPQLQLQSLRQRRGEAPQFYQLQNNNLAKEVWELFSPTVRKKVRFLGCVPLRSMPTHCAAQVHNSNTALNRIERVAAALSAALQHFCQHWIHSELWIIQGLFKTTL